MSNIADDTYLPRRTRRSRQPLRCLVTLTWPHGPGGLQGHEDVDAASVSAGAAKEEDRFTKRLAPILRGKISRSS
jgi:hypothetical protein